MVFALGALALQAATLVALRHSRDAHAQDRATQLAAGAFERLANLPCAAAATGSLHLDGITVEWATGAPTPAGTRDFTQTVRFNRTSGERVDRFAGAVRCR